MQKLRHCLVESASGALRTPTFNTAMSGSRRIAAHSDTDYVRRNEREMVA